MHEPPFLSPRVPPDHILVATAAADGAETAGDRRRDHGIRVWLRTLSTWLGGTWLGRFIRARGARRG